MGLAISTAKRCWLRTPAPGDVLGKFPSPMRAATIPLRGWEKIVSPGPSRRSRRAPFCRVVEGVISSKIAYSDQAAAKGRLIAARNSGTRLV